MHASFDRLLPVELRSIFAKVVEGVRISDQDALTLYASNDLQAVGMIADHVRRQKNGDRASYILNRYINYSNLCIL